VIKELANMGFEESEVLKASGKTGEGVEGILKAVIERLPAYAALRCSAGFTRLTTHTHRIHTLVPTCAHIARNRPSGDPAKPLKALLFENWYDQFRGVVCLVNILDGALKKGTKTTHTSTTPPSSPPQRPTHGNSLHSTPFCAVHRSQLSQ
jgi:translation elongation factor EF-4